MTPNPPFSAIATPSEPTTQGFLDDDDTFIADHADVIAPIEAEYDNCIVVPLSRLTVDEDGINSGDVDSFDASFFVRSVTLVIWNDLRKGFCVVKHACDSRTVAAASGGGTGRRCDSSTNLAHRAWSIGFVTADLPRLFGPAVFPVA